MNACMSKWALAAGLAVAGAGVVNAAGTRNDSKTMDMSRCQEMMGGDHGAMMGKDHEGMMGKGHMGMMGNGMSKDCQEMMQKQGMTGQDMKNAQAAQAQGTGTVQSVDAAAAR